MDEPIWRPVPGFPLEVANDGTVRTITRHVRGGNNLRVAKSRVLVQYLRRRYLAVSTSSAGKQRSVSVHVLVAAAFIGPRPLGAFVLHNNGDNMDNRAENLRYGTPSENAEDSRKHGTMQLGTNHCNSVLTPDSVLAIRAARVSGESFSRIGARFGVSGTTARSIVRRKTWRAVPDSSPAAPASLTDLAVQAAKGVTP